MEGPAWGVGTEGPWTGGPGLGTGMGPTLGLALGSGRLLRQRSDAKFSRALETAVKAFTGLEKLGSGAPPGPP